MELMRLPWILLKRAKRACFLAGNCRPFASDFTREITVRGPKHRQRGSVRRRARTSSAVYARRSEDTISCPNVRPQFRHTRMPSSDIVRSGLLQQDSSSSSFIVGRLRFSNRFIDITHTNYYFAFVKLKGNFPDLVLMRLSTIANESNFPGGLSCDDGAGAEAC